MYRDGALKSLWQQNLKKVNTNHQPLQEFYDVAVIGGGITGLTTALNLQKAGKKCVLFEAINIGFGTTGGTTAHLNNFFDTPYSQVIKDFGEEEARLLAKAAREAILTVKACVDELGIDCGFEKKTAWLFAIDEQQEKILDDVIKGARAVGVEMKEENHNPYNIPFTRIVSVPGQAQFDPVKYINALAEAFIDKGGHLFDKCRVMNIDQKEKELSVETARGTIRCSHAVYATHTPPGNISMHMRNAPYRSYALAVTLQNNHYPDGPGYDLYDPYHYYRSQEVNGKMYLIAGGEDHKTGHDDNAAYCFQKLENYVRGVFDVDEVAFKWSSQFYEPVDGLPYIGKANKGEEIYLATGFSGNGMIYGTLSGNIIADLILYNQSKYEKLFDPTRSKPIAGFTSFVKENADVVKSFIGDKISVDKIESLQDLAPGEGRSVSYNGESLSAYKDDAGNVHLLKSACTHLGCNVKWNNAEKSWDCPCHGSRFGVDGSLLTGPAVKALEKVESDSRANAEYDSS